MESSATSSGTTKSVAADSRPCIEALIGRLEGLRVDVGEQAECVRRLLCELYDDNNEELFDQLRETLSDLSLDATKCAMVIGRRAMHAQRNREAAKAAERAEVEGPQRKSSMWQRFKQQFRRRRRRGSREVDAAPPFLETKRTPLPPAPPPPGPVLAKVSPAKHECTSLYPALDCRAAYPPPLPSLSSNPLKYLVMIRTSDLDSEDDDGIRASFQDPWVPGPVQPNRSPSNQKARANMLLLLLLVVGAAALEVGSQGLEWAKIGFEYRTTRCFVHYEYRDGAWNDGREVKEPYLPVHVGATALHYGQSLFEGLKAFATPDNKVKLFRPYANAHRMQRGAERTLMACPPPELFVSACARTVRANLDYVPPYGSGGALYVRPLLFGSGPRIGLQPADAYDFAVIATPVGEYYGGGGGVEPVRARIVDADRAAPRGVGNVKLAGNYAPDLQPNLASKKLGYPISLYLDAKSRTYVEEFSTSNFLAIKDAEYITPDSNAVLPSITNDSLMKLAEKKGLTSRRRPVRLDELADFDEVAACGTAVVVTPIASISLDDRVIAEFPTHPVSTALFTELTDIQRGEAPDPFSWMEDVADLV
ncbi:hypothetical protein CTAYLR_004124 [Chrysophaeum taylorii]|uniref:Branched-chain amino acid aminotransferase n=1 Tax=Chrysophaeum taylorii TaxID=2483200 RepID=A0AAD7UFC6_9STRA|nr:hypothetical protein CTAYLR_004124 [Chrysophaeum taylorii]